MIKLNFFKNEAGEYHCPVTYKTFTDHSHIVAVRETGNVYSYSAYLELNKEPQYFFDLMTNDKFDPKKLMTIQDPKSPGRHRSLYAFNKKSGAAGDTATQEESKKPQVVEQSGTQRRIMDSLKKDGGLGATKELKTKYRDNPAFNIEEDELDSNLPMKKAKKEAGQVAFEMPIEKPSLADLRLEPKEYFKFVRSQNKHLSHRESDGQAGASFSCTTMRMVTQQTKRELTNDEMRKAYVDIVKSKQS